MKDVPSGDLRLPAGPSAVAELCSRQGSGLQYGVGHGWRDDTRDDIKRTVVVVDWVLAHVVGRSPVGRGGVDPIVGLERIQGQTASERVRTRNFNMSIGIVNRMV